MTFKDYMERRIEASDAFVAGDVGPLLRISATASPATIFPPNGICVQGADTVNTFNAEGAASFAPGSSNSFEIMHSGESDTLAYWTGIQHSTVVMKGKDEPVPMALRVTEIFRKDNGEWKLIHRHADPFKG